MLIKSATTEECEYLFRKDLERYGRKFERSRFEKDFGKHFDRYKRKWQKFRMPAPSVSQAASAQGLGSGPAVAISTTTGHLLVLIAFQGANNTSTVAVTDSAGNAWTLASAYVSGTSSDRFAMFYSPAANAITTVTATWSGGISATCATVVFEISGAAAVNPLDGFVSSNGGGVTNTTLTSGALTTTNPSDLLLYGVGVGANQSSWTVGGSFTIPANGSITNGRAAMQFRQVTGIQSAVTTSMTWNSTSTQRDGIFVGISNVQIGVGPTPYLDLAPGAGGCALDSPKAVAW